MRPRSTPAPAENETLPGGTAMIPAETEAVRVAQLLTEELMYTLPDGLARDEDAPQLAQACRRTALTTMLGVYFLAVGVVPGLTALAGDEVAISPASVSDQVVLNAIALRITRGFAARSLAIFDWLAFAPDDELIDMLAADADESAE